MPSMGMLALVGRTWTGWPSPSGSGLAVDRGCVDFSDSMVEGSDTALGALG